ncbi:hypothetical protein NBRC116495_26420 [Aurantivibrio plasticivorans]
MEQFQRLAQVEHSSSLAGLKRPCITYIGNVGLAQNLITLIEAAKKLPDVDFKVVGGGSELARIERAARHVSNIEMLGRVAWDSIPAAYQRADILWAQLAPEFAGAVPSKLYEYLATGKPVIYGGLGEAISVISEFENVKVVEPCSVPQLVSSVRETLAAHKQLELSLNNRKIIEDKYIREISVERFYQWIGEWR